MENLQKVAEAVHADFVASGVKQLEQAAHEGKFTFEMSGTFEELRAMGNFLRKMGYAYNIETGINYTLLFIQWHTAP